MKQPVSIKKPEGKLGVLLPGMGAVATTFIAGVSSPARDSASRSARSRRWARSASASAPRTASPLIKDFVAARRARRPRVRRLGHLPGQRLRVRRARRGARAASTSTRSRTSSRAIKPMSAVFYPEYVKRLHGTHVKTGARRRREHGRAARAPTSALQEGQRLLALRRRVVRLDRGLHPSRARSTSRSQAFEKGLDDNDPGDRQLADLRLGAASRRASRSPTARRTSPSTSPPRASSRASTSVPIARQGLQDRPDADEDDHRARPQGAHARPPRLVLDQHPRQPRRRGARRSRELQDQGGLEARRARAHPAAASSTRSSTATSSTRSASSTTRRAATPRRAGTTSISSVGSATRCR